MLPLFTASASVAHIYMKAGMSFAVLSIMLEDIKRRGKVQRRGFTVVFESVSIYEQTNLGECCKAPHGRV